ncbi:TetR/AcrR family transcriptional regulator [Sporosalibacterium faouarense]|uniref:TetR/AcrR family transcriptional regulator n=1 Tax=Sporosalibacterium faouarense TaxID=516123 RepID=UPI00192AB84E|nr:TetR/AcrR family transcriptional regulator [Sporosalibacterium faouarense]
MNESFKQLDKEKQQRILNAAYIEFTKNRYKKASTNQIVKSAGIGKGMLFHYFNSKKELFNDLVEMSIQFVQEEYLDKIPNKNLGFIEKYKLAAKAKLNAMLKNSYAFSFLASIYLNNFEDVQEEVKNKTEYVKNRGLDKLYSNIDYSCFRDDIPPETIIKLITWSVEGYQTELLYKLKSVDLIDTDMDPYWKEFDELLELLKTLYYKKGDE